MSERALPRAAAAGEPARGPHPERRPEPAARARIPVALTIAGSDSSGGAGVQADLKTFSALGVYGASVITAVTAQNTRAVTAVWAVPADLVRAQLDAVLDDLAVAAVKLGMLHDAAIIEAVAAGLECRPRIPVVLDPVMVAKSGAALLAREAAVSALVQRLLPRATVITPNLPEAAVLLGCDEAEVQADPRRACARLRALGPQAVLLKGGHAGGENSDDLLDTGGELLTLPAQRLATRHTHGTGCTLAAALAAGLAHGLGLAAAAAAAKRYITLAIAGADALCQQLGAPASISAPASGGFPETAPIRGHGPVHHFAALWPTSPRDLLP